MNGSRSVRGVEGRGAVPGDAGGRAREGHPVHVLQSEQQLEIGNVCVCMRCDAYRLLCLVWLSQVRYTNSNQRIPDFPIEPELALEVLMAAYFFDC